MEYPTFITTLPAWVAPRGAHFFEDATVHEFGHQYFYGMLATNEFEEAWMDEGINSYVTGLVLDRMFGSDASGSDFFGVRSSDTADRRLGFAARADWDPLETFAWRFAPGTYFSVYSKTTVALRTLEGYLGHDRMMAALGSYARTWRFKHPHAQDFFDAFS